MLLRFHSLGCLLAACLVACAAGGGEPAKLDPAGTQARLKELRGRLDKVGKEGRESLRRELLRLQADAAATPAALEAARLVMTLPSPLDELDPAKIPAGDRPAWLPGEVVAVLGSQRGRVWGSSIDALALSPDGKHLITGGYGGLRLWDARTFAEVALVRRDMGTVRGLALSRDGRTLVVLADNYRGAKEGPKSYWEIWDVLPTALKLRATPGSGPQYEMGPRPLAPTFLADGQTVLVSARDGLEFWDVSTSPPARRKTLGRKDLNPQEDVSGVAISEDGTTLVLLHSPGRNEGKKRKEFKEKEEFKKEACEPEQGQGVKEAGPARFSLAVWDLRKDGRPRKVVLPDPGIASGIALSPDGKSVAVLWHLDKKIWIDFWDLAAAPPRVRATLPLADFPFWESLLIHRGNRLVVLAAAPPAFAPGKGGEVPARDTFRVRQWDLSGPQLRELPAFSVPRPRLGSRIMPAFTSDGKSMILPSGGGELYRWDLDTGKPDREVPKVGHTDWVTCVRFLPDGRRLASGGYDKTIRLWEPARGSFEEKTVLQQGGDVFDLAIAPQRELLVSTGFNPTRVRLWDLRARPVREREELPRLKSHAWGSVFSPDGATLYTCTGLENLHDSTPEEEKTDDAIFVWDVRGAKAKERAAVRGHAGAVMSLAMSPDGKVLASGGGRIPSRKDADPKEIAELRLWDIRGAEPKETARLKGHSKVIYSVAFSPDGKLLASTGRDQTVRLWDLTGKEPKELAVLKRHEHPVFSVTFSPDGKLLASCDFHGRIVVWDVAKRAVRREWHLPGRVARVAFAPDGRHLASANANGTVYVFRLGPAPN
jgi:WD40 repeat protein